MMANQQTLPTRIRHKGQLLHHTVALVLLVIPCSSFSLLSSRLPCGLPNRDARLRERLLYPLHL